jgi:hypothetical protein
MPEAVGTFLSTKLWHERAKRSVETSNGPRGDLAQQCLEFTVGHLDGKVGRISRQVAKLSPGPRISAVQIDRTQTDLLQCPPNLLAFPAITD